MKRTLLLGMLLTLGALAQAGDGVVYYQVGDRLDPITLKDQHDQAHEITGETQLVLFTTGMKGGAVVREVLDKEPPEYLASRQAAFVSNISGMPKIIASAIALPSMRGHKYPILLDQTGEVTRRIPSRDNSATILVLKDLQVQSIEFTRSPDAVRAATSALPASP